VDVEYYRKLVRPLVEGRKFILVGEVLAGFTHFVEQLELLGADRPFIIATGAGTGPTPDPARAERIVVEISATDVVDAIRNTNALLGDLPDHVTDAIDRWDPNHDAVVLGHAFFAADHVAGRPVWGARRTEWEALEDKVRADTIWDAAGVAREESTVVHATIDELQLAHSQLDRGLGTVLAGDAREGFNGGAVYLRWVRSDENIEEAHSFFSRHCDTVRVMPFLEGIPCSIQGVVFPDDVIALRPAELIVLRPASGISILYAGTATYWDPPDDDREAMRDMARAVGRVLRDTVDYRGGFTVDGIMTADGFRPTELNARTGASIGPIVSAVRDLPFGLLRRALIEGTDLDYRPRDLERLIVESADSHRGGAAYTTVERSRTETETRWLARAGDDFRVVDERRPHVATLEFGPGPSGGFIRFHPDPESTPVGESLAPMAANALAVADEMWDLGLGRLTPARPVR
jgi:hypothetical protein